MHMTVSKTKRSKTICLSHMEDTDGISSAALVKMAFGGETILTDYPGLMSELEKVAGDEKLKTLYICDLGLSKKNQEQFVELLASLRKKRVSVTYVDHHDMDKMITKKLQKINIKLIHDPNECTSVLLHNAFKSKLSEHSAFVAACAAITDYMDDRPLGSKLLQVFDRQMALIEATVLTYNIVGRQKDMDYLLYLVDELSESKYPHDIPNTFEFAQIQVGKLAASIEIVKKKMKIMKNLGYMEVLDSGASGVANFVLGMSAKDVGVTYKLRKDHGIYAVSVRGSKSCKLHLGRIVNVLSTELGGSGGGHDKACGAVIPKDKMKKFLTQFNAKLN